MTGNEFWLSSRDAAERVGVRQRTLYGFVNRGELPGYRFGRVFRFKVADIERFIESRRIESGSIAYAPAPRADRSTDGAIGGGAAASNSPAGHRIATTATRECHR